MSSYVMLRSFNPVGQGAFVTEHFYEEDEERFSVVFDAGVLSSSKLGGGVKRAKNLVGATLVRNTPIYILVSHLDEDHVRFVPYILENFNVRALILPRFSCEQLAVFAVEYALSSRRNRSVLSIVQKIYRWESGGHSDESNNERDGRYREVDIFLVNSENLVQEDRPFEPIPLGDSRGGAVRDVPSGQPFWLPIPSGLGRSGGFCRWTLRTYFLENHRSTARDFWQDLSAEFPECAPDEIEQLCQGADAYERLQSFTRCAMIKNRGLLRKIYRKHWGNLNRDSMIAASFPDPNCDWRFQGFTPPHRLRPFRHWPYWDFYLYDDFHLYDLYDRLYKRPGALYTGDSNAWELPLKIIDVQTLGAIQVPHHGSIHSWDSRLANSSAPFYFAGYGVTNSYGHPAPYVIRDLVLRRKFPYFYDEFSPSLAQVYGLV